MKTDMNHDLRYKRTRQSIQDAFLSLIITKSVNKITVTEISKLAGISRKTFYDHFLDIYDMIDYLSETAFLSTYENLIDSYHDIEMYTTLKGLLLFLRQNIDISKTALLPENNGFIFRNIIYLISKKHIKSIDNKIKDDLKTSYELEFIISGMEGV
ncbi:TetR/AcrR family transcriptional regulator [Fusibacter sp. 3D3]|uniref:TetR/AcrR family transcriptional regulator n=1 Tax=Fusibacter sp. 3D3 TaxID=1048380 RepID=UPI00085390BB|nr:TetR/AcrR family transcriptional regulator [Fusibacter sp. 3D3]GAU80106.1 transcriptional regulator [Fusibacter sp. 3D3]